LRSGQSAYISTFNAISYIEQYTGYTYPVGYETKAILKQHIDYFCIAPPMPVLFSQRIFHPKQHPLFNKEKRGGYSPI
jgi:hypothetical protein